VDLIGDSMNETSKFDKGGGVNDSEHDKKIMAQLRKTMYGKNLSNYDRDVVREDMLKFVSIAKMSKNGKDFIEKSNKINVSPTTSDWFFERYYDLDVNKVADKFLNEVKNDSFDINEIY
jgi:hypothetical protein